MIVLFVGYSFLCFISNVNLAFRSRQNSCITDFLVEEISCCRNHFIYDVKYLVRNVAKKVHTQHYLYWPLYFDYTDEVNISLFCLINCFKEAEQNFWAFLFRFLRYCIFRWFEKNPKFSPHTFIQTLVPKLLRITTVIISQWLESHNFYEDTLQSSIFFCKSFHVGLMFFEVKNVTSR